MPGSILLVDDDPKVLRLLEATLRLKDYEVARAEDAAGALAWLAEFTPDLVISDVVMPGMDGWELFRRVREAEGTARVPFIFLSSRGGPDGAVPELRLGADEFLRKPFAIEELLVRVDRVLARRPGGTAASTELRGSLGQFPLPDLVSMLAGQRRTGALELCFPGDSAGATVHFREGAPYHAEFGLLVGRPALYQALIREDGSFEFHEGDRRELRTIDGSPLAILLDAFRLIDEGVLHRIDPLRDADVDALARVARRSGSRASLPEGTPTHRVAAAVGFQPPSSVEILAVEGAPSVELASLTEERWASRTGDAWAPVTDDDLETEELDPPPPHAAPPARTRSRVTPFLPPPPPSSAAYSLVVPARAGPPSIEIAAASASTDSEEPIEEEFPPTGITLAEPGPGPVERVFAAFGGVAGRRQMDLQVSTSRGEVLASTLHDRDQRERLGAFAASAFALAGRDARGAYAEVSFGDLHLLVIELPGRRILTCVGRVRPDAEAVLARVREAIGGV